MRVGIIGLLQESNTFLKGETTLEHFEDDVLAVGEAVRERFAGAPHEIGGFFAGLARHNVTAVPLFAARALPYGVVTSEAFDTLLEWMFAAIDRARPLDGLLVAPHGATVCESAPDADGTWLARLRALVGPSVPIISTLDLHANLSPLMVASCDAIVGYRTNPHLDQRATGEKAAELMVRTLRGEIRPTMAAAYPPLAINIERQFTGEPPCHTVFEIASKMLVDPDVLSNSILLGFPYADVAEMGASCIVVTDDDRVLANRLVLRLAEELWTRRKAFLGAPISIDEAISHSSLPPGPYALFDMGDNVGGGSPGDSTHLAAAVHAQSTEPAFVCLYDPEAVCQATSAGVGAWLELAVGGKSDDQHGQPIVARFEVLGLYDGKFRETEARHGGFTDFDQGPTAVVRSERQLTVMLTTRRMAPFSLQQLLACDLHPQNFQRIIVKGVQAPVAAYDPVCREILRVNTPGVTCADMTQLPFQHRREPMFPFEPETTWDAWG